MGEREGSPVSKNSPDGERNEPDNRQEPARQEQPEERKGTASQSATHQQKPAARGTHPTPKPSLPAGGKARPGQPAPPDDDVVEEGGLTVKLMPWALFIAGLALIGAALYVWNEDDPTRVSAQITRITSKTTAPDAGKAGTTTLDSTEKVVSVTNLHSDDKFRQGVLRGIAQPRQRPYATGGATAGPPAGAAGPHTRASGATTRVSGAAATGPSGSTGATGPTGAGGATGEEGSTATTATSGSTGATGAQAASTAPAAPSKRSETLTLSLVFLGALFALGGAFYSRVTALEAGPSGIKISLKALRHLKEGVLKAAAEARAEGQEVPPSAVVDAFAVALERATAAATVAAGRPAAVTAARTPIGTPPPMKVKGKKVVMAPDHLEEIGRNAFNSTLAGNPDFS